MPIFRQILERGAGGNLPLFVSPLRIIDITAVGHLALADVFRLGHDRYLLRNSFLVALAARLITKKCAKAGEYSLIRLLV